MALVVIPKSDGSWQSLSVWPRDGLHRVADPELGMEIATVSGEVLQKGDRWALNPSDGDPRRRVLGVRLMTEHPGYDCVGIFVLENTDEHGAREAAIRLELVAGIPADFEYRRRHQHDRTPAVTLADVLDLMVLINSEEKYLAAGMTLCNELAARYRCLRVSLGWIQREYVRLQTVSHMERFEKKMDAVQSMETAMEEALDQDEEIILPKPDQSTVVVKDHKSYAQAQGVSYLISLPIRLGTQPVGVLMCERSAEAGPFGSDDVNGLRLACDHSACRLSDLKARDRWFGARMVTSVRNGLGGLVGYEHTLAKLTGLLLCGVLAVLIFGKWDFRVEAPFNLKTDTLGYLTAGFDGYIDRTYVDAGDAVCKGDLLLVLDTSELLIQESNAIANRVRYAREAEKYRAQNSLAEMKIARAKEDQALAQLEMVRYRLDHAELRAPFDGIIIEGDLKEMLGAPVRKGDILFKIARLDSLYVEASVQERDIYEIKTGMRGEIAFVSRPELTFPITIQEVSPAAETGQEGNVFKVRTALVEQAGTWWRPGMEGIAKIDAGKRSMIWILTHRTVDFLRLALWW